MSIHIKCCQSLLHGFILCTKILGNIVFLLFMSSSVLELSNDHCCLTILEVAPQNLTYYYYYFAIGMLTLRHKLCHTVTNSPNWLETLHYLFKSYFKMCNFPFLIICRKQSAMQPLIVELIFYWLYQQSSNKKDICWYNKKQCKRRILQYHRTKGVTRPHYEASNKYTCAQNQDQISLPIADCIIQLNSLIA